MAVTTNDIEAIINGAPIEIETPYPLDHKAPGFQWFMAQPDDWLYDMASAVREAAIAEAMAQPEIKAVEHLPPTESWLLRQMQSKEAIERKIAEFQAKPALTPEEDLELASLTANLLNLIDPTTYNRAKEIVATRARRAYESYLIPRLIVDVDGRKVFDQNTEDGKRRWLLVGQEVKMDLRQTFYQVILLVDTAKNYKAGKSSGSK